MFPEEITRYPQWICWRYSQVDGKATKLPYNPRTGNLASVSDPSSWCDYATAVNIATKNSQFYSGIGFVLTEADPFCFIDLDDPQGDPTIVERQQSIADAFDSYSELSPSGKGLHIIVKAKVAGGRRRDKIEIYSSMRYMTMTGQTFHNKPINERDILAQKLWGELNSNGGGNNIQLSVVDQQQKNTDEFIYTMASQAENGSKFEDLWRGDWQSHYKSQSEADFALINILGFYSRNVEQIRRMFLMSVLGKRDKAKRKSYVDGMIKRSFDNMPPAIPLEQIITSVANKLAVIDAEKDKQAALTSANPFAGPLFEGITDPKYDWTMPPGLLGEITEFIYQAAPRPVKEIALGAAIGLMAGICGRAYNVSGTGLNQYVLILAKTGVGKEGAASGIDKLMQQVKLTVPAALDFMGPAEIASGQALTKYLGKHPCFVSIVGEFGLMLQQMCSPMASAAQVSLRRRLLEVYNKSGASDVLRPTIYSDTDNNTNIVKSPAFSLLGESTPETFYVSLDETMISQGLLPRFTCIEYLGDRPPLNPEHERTVPSERLVNKMAELCAISLMVAQHNRTVNIQLDAEAKSYSDIFNIKCDGKINTSEFEVARQLWNRAHIKTLKLAALIAIGINVNQPVVTLECIKWAAHLVERDVMNILKNFESGKAGRESGELNQINVVVTQITDYVRRPYTGLEKYGVTPLMHGDKVFTMSYLQRRLLQNSAFKHDRIGATASLKRTVDSLIQEGSVRELRQLDVYNRYGKTMKAYIVVDPERF